MQGAIQSTGDVLEFHRFGEKTRDTDASVICLWDRVGFSPGTAQQGQCLAMSQAGGP